MGRVKGLGYVAVLGLVAACGVDEHGGLAGLEQGITNGDPVADDQFPTIGMLLARGNIAEAGGAAQNRIMGLCTGTLISPTAVLTAEHCVNQMILKQSLGQDPRMLTIEGDVTFQFTFARSIATVQAGTATLLEVSKVDESETFAPTSNPLAAFDTPPAKWDDIAIVHLAQPVTGRPFQRLATKEVVAALTSDEASMYRAAGYGLTNDDDPMSAGTLTAGLSHLDEVGDNEITAGNGDRQQACRGDSGGPLFASESDDYQIGIASRIAKPFDIGDIGATEPPPCETGLAYTRVDAYLDWIAERVPDLPAPGDGPMVGDGSVDGDGEAADGSSDGDVGEGDGAADGTDTSIDPIETPRKRHKGCSVAPGSSGEGALFGLALFGLGLVVRRRRRG